MEKVFYLVTDEGTCEHKLFTNRSNALYYMLSECEKMAAILYTPNHISFGIAFDDKSLTSGEIFTFVTNQNDSAINEIFESYFYLESIPLIEN